MRGLDADCCIVGGGPVGLFLSAALGQAGLRCLLLEARTLNAAAGDGRALALSWSSHLKLLRIGVDLRQGGRASAIDAIHVTHAGRPGRTVLGAREARVGALGFVIGYGDLIQAILPAAGASAQVRDECPVEDIVDEGEGVRVVTPKADFRSRAVIVADGSAQFVRKLGAKVDTQDYGVHALVSHVTVQQPITGVAHERFGRHGPLALLPDGNGYALVWTLSASEATSLRDVPRAAFLGRLQSEFGWRLGRITSVGERKIFALALRRTDPVCLGRVALVGNAAQTLHPVAGQGLNLGLRDAWQLKEHIVRTDGDPASSFPAYLEARRVDRALTIGFTDVLARAFGIDFPGADVLRGAAIEALDILPVARRAFARALAVTPHR